MKNLRKQKRRVRIKFDKNDIKDLKLSLSVTPKERLLHLDRLVNFYRRVTPKKSKKLSEELKKQGW